MKYTIIFSFQVFENIKAGKEVFALDREENSVFRLSEVSVGCLCALLSKGNDVVEFWIVEREESKS